MKPILLILALGLVGCGSSGIDFERIFAPDIVSVTDTLRSSLAEVLYMTLESELCHKMEKLGYPCDMEDQLYQICFTPIREPAKKQRLDYDISICLKEKCPLEEQIVFNE